MDGSHSKDSIPLEPEGNRRFETVYCRASETASFLLK